MLEINNMNHPLNSILLLKERLIKVETLFEKYASLTKKYNDLEKLYHQSIESEKKAKKDATKYLEKYCKLSKKCDTLSCEIENYEATLKKKIDALEEVKMENERIESLLQIYKQERSVLQKTSVDSIKKDKDFLLSSTWKLFKESDKNKNRLAIAIFFKRFKDDLENLKLEDFRNIKPNETSKSSETKAVLTSHEKQSVNIGKSDSFKNDSAIESAKMRPLDQNKGCNPLEKFMHLEQQEYTGSICEKLDHHSDIRKCDFLNFNANIQTGDSLNTFFYDTLGMKNEHLYKENSSPLYECSALDSNLDMQMLEEIDIGQNVSVIKNEVPETKNELCHKRNRTDFSIRNDKSNYYNNFEEPFISPEINNVANRMHNSDQLIERKLFSNYNTLKSTDLNHSNKTDLDFKINRGFINCKTYKKKSKKSPILHIKFEKDLPVPCENIDYVGNPSEVLMLNTDIINGDLKISPDTLDRNGFILSKFNSIDKSEEKKDHILKAMPNFLEENNEVNCQPKNILANNHSIVTCNSIFSIENETFDIDKTEIKNSYEEINNFSLEFGEENKNTVNGNTNNIVFENIFEKDGKPKCTLEDTQKIHENDLKNKEQNSKCETPIFIQTKVSELTYEDTNPSKSTNSKKFIESFNAIPDEDINKIFQTLVNVPLLSPIKDMEQKQNVKHKLKEIINNSKCLGNSEKDYEAVRKTDAEIIKISVNDMTTTKDCRKLINQSSSENKLVDLKNISLKEKTTEDKFVQTDTIKDISKEEKSIQCTETCDIFKKLPLTFDKLILKMCKKINREILKRKSPKKRKIFDRFVKKCENHCLCLDFILVLLKILNFPQLNYDKMIKFTIKRLKMMKNLGTEDNNNEQKLVSNNSSSHDSSTSTEIMKNSEDKMCKNTKLAGKIFDDQITNFFYKDFCLDKMDLNENPVNESNSEAEELIQTLKNDSKLYSIKKESPLKGLEAKKESEELFTFQKKEFYTPPIISPFESDVLDGEELDYSINTSYSYKNIENTNNSNTFEYDPSQIESKLCVADKELSSFCKQDNSHEGSDFNIHKDVSNNLHEKLDDIENVIQDCTLGKKRRISHGNFGLNCEINSENKNIENSKSKKKAIRQIQQSVICRERKNLNNLTLQVNGKKQDMERESSVNFLDSILSAMTKQAEYFKASVPVPQTCDFNSVSFSAQQASSNSLNKSNLEQKQENEILEGNSTISNDSYVKHTINSTEESQNESHAKNVTVRKIKSRTNYEDTEMKRFVEKAIKEFLKGEINSTIEAEEKMKPCIAVLEKAEKSIISKVIVSEIMTNVDEELQEFDRPAPPLTKTQHRLICILTVLTESNNEFSSISNNILKVIRSKIFPENFFWPDDSLETATRFYTALCKKLNNFKEIWKFCFKALTYMRQRWSIIVFVVLQTWPDILHDASKVKDNILVNTFVNLILHSSKSDECRRKRQQNRLLALKHLLKNFYEFEVNCTMEDYTKKIFQLFFADTVGADKALVLISKCKDWCWTKKHIIPKLSESIIAWADGNIDDVIGKKSLQIIHQISWIIPVTDNIINSSTEVMISGLQRLLNSENLNQISKEKVIKILCELKHHDNVKEILSSSLEQFSYNIELFKKIQKAILLPNTENSSKEIELKKNQNKPLKAKIKKKKVKKKKSSNSKPKTV